MNPEELAAVSEALEQLRKGGTVTAETLNKLGGTTQGVNKALQGYAQKLVGATAAVGGMAKTVADGEGSFKSLGGVITGLTGVIGKLASAIPLVGGAAQALAEGVGEAAKFVLDQLDTMAKNYQTLGDASAGAADGVDGLLRQFNQLGNYSLPAFTKAVKANTLGLAALRGSASAGAEELSKVAGGLTTGDVANKFLKLGIGLDAVGDATTAYLSDSARYGITQGATTDELIKKTQAYILEVDKIARLTGQTREAQAREAQKSLVDARFRAKLAELTANGQKEQAEQLRIYVEGLGGAAGDAARALVTGIPLTKEAAEANIFTGDTLRQATQDIIQGNKRASQAIVETQDAMSSGADTFNILSQYGKDLGGLTVQALDQQAIIRKENKSAAERLADTEEAQRRQGEASGKTTEEFVDAQLAVAGASKNLQSLGFSLSTAAVPAVNKFAKALDDVTGYINKNFGVGGTKSTPAGVDRGPAGGPRASSQDLQRAVNAAIKEYEQVTGKHARITSGQRSREEQQRLYNEYIARGRTGMPVAPPGTSKHETGNAVDIDQISANEMAQLGILQKHGLTRPVANDPVHVELAGPSSRYNSPTADVKAPTAGDDTKAQAQKTQDQQVDTSSMNTMTKQLALLNQTAIQQLSLQKKLLAKTS